MDWSKEPRGRARDDLEELINPGSSLSYWDEGEDKWWWFLAEDGSFAVSKLRRLDEEKILGTSDSGVVIPRCKLVPLKVFIFIWRLSLGKLPVREYLNHIGFDLHSVLCPRCGLEVESLDHCFATCSNLL